MQDKSIEEFLNSLNNAEWTALDILGQIEKIGKEQNLERKVIDYLVTKVQEYKNV